MITIHRQLSNNHNKDLFKHYCSSMLEAFTSSALAIEWQDIIYLLFSPPLVRAGDY